MIERFARRAIILCALFLFCTAAALAAPAISKISPTVGPVSPVGSSITITGSGFGATQGTSSVTVGGLFSAPSTWSDSKVVAPVPNSLLPGFYDVVVTVAGTASNAPGSGSSTASPRLRASPFRPLAPTVPGKVAARCQTARQHLW